MGKTKGISVDLIENKLKTERDTIAIKDIFEGYINNSQNEEGGVTSMNGRLNIQPRYQRTYVVGDDKVWKEELIGSILNSRPIHEIFIGVESGDAKNKQKNEWNLEVLDGQQRLTTICDFMAGAFGVHVNGSYCWFGNLQNEYKKIFENYPLQIIYCIGEESERIKYFKTINKKNYLLENQELRNSTYVGNFTEDAKKYFCATSNNKKKEINNEDGKYCITRFTLKKRINRCDFLEVALDWISYGLYNDLNDKDDEDERICRYMAQHQKDDNAKELIDYYHKVIDWIIDTFWYKQDGFPVGEIFKRAEWGRLYREYGAKIFTNDEKENMTEKCLRINEQFYSNPSGVFEWAIQGGKEEEKDKYLKIRDFADKDKIQMYKFYQKGIDPIDGKHYKFEEMHAHHIKPKCCGGLSTMDNMVLLSGKNHRRVHNESFITSEELKNKKYELLKKHGVVNEI